MEYVTPYNIAAVMLSYLLGSIPTAVWVGKRFFNTDVRDHGSGNSGATNTFRVLGKKAGIPVLLFDIFKGWIAVFGFSYFSVYEMGTNEYVNFQLALGMAAVLGHIFSVFLKFSGGKGIATLLGMIIAIHPLAALVCIVIFSITFLISKYVSLGSITAAVLFPVVVIGLFRTETPSLMYFSGLIAVLVLLTHQKNILRLLRNEENKVNLKSKHS